MAVLAALSRAARAAWPLIQAGVRGGIPTRQIGELLQSFSLNLRPGELSIIARAERAIQRLGADLRFLNRNQSPAIERIPEALSKIRRQFSFTVEVRGTLTATGSPFSQLVTVTSSRNLTRAEMEELAISAVASNGERYGMEVEDAVPIRALRQGELGALS